MEFFAAKSLLVLHVNNELRYNTNLFFVNLFGTES